MQGGIGWRPQAAAEVAGGLYWPNPAESNGLAREARTEQQSQRPCTPADTHLKLHRQWQYIMHALGKLLMPSLCELRHI